jgi:hypothetical protein
MNSRFALAIAILIASASATLGLFAPRDALIGWLGALALFASASLGAAMLTCMLTLGRSRLLDAWRIPLSFGSAWFGLAFAFAVAIVVGVTHIFDWGAEAFRAQQGYLNEPFFVVRWVVCFAAWIIATRMMMSRQAWKIAIALLIFFVVTNLIAFDWIMALAPAWHSSDFGLRWSVDGLLIAATIAVGWTSRDVDVRGRIDGATLLFALNLGWIYLMFVDYVTAWSGNLSDEAAWYGVRTHGAWAMAAMTFVTIHLVVAALLSMRTIKSSAMVLRGVVTLILIAQCIETEWTIVPGLNIDAAWTTVALFVSLVVMAGLSFVVLRPRHRTTATRAHAHG